MASVDDKLDQLLTDVATIKATNSYHTAELTELKEKLDPVFDHVIGMRFLFKCVAGLVAIGTLAATIAGMFK